jgi:secretion/DNA translocation related TadE-like protein
VTTGRCLGLPDRRGQAGSASLLVVTLSGVVLLLGLAAAFVTATAAAHRRAQSAADLVALAGAVAQERGDDACSSAADLARGNGAELVACEVLADDVRVTVRVPGPTLVGHDWEVIGRARAGPAP